MDLNQGLRSTHDLKKVTYRMLRKLRRLKTHHSFENSHKFDDEYCVILYLRHMVETINDAYKYKDAKIKNIVKHLTDIITLLKVKTNKELMIYHPLLVRCLTRHTYVFNRLEEYKIPITINAGLRNLWIQCVTAYLGACRT